MYLLLIYIIYYTIATSSWLARSSIKQWVSLQGVPENPPHHWDLPRINGPWGRAFERAEEERLKAEAKRQKEAEEVVPSRPPLHLLLVSLFWSILMFNIYFLLFRSVMPVKVVVFRFFLDLFESL